METFAWIIVCCLLSAIWWVVGYRLGGDKARIEEREKCSEAIKALKIVKNNTPHPMCHICLKEPATITISTAKGHLEVCDGCSLNFNSRLNDNQPSNKE